MYKQLRKDKLALTFLKPNKFNRRLIFSYLDWQTKIIQTNLHEQRIYCIIIILIDFTSYPSNSHYA